jgi:predicted negative regulator of RcsB-dependent stress response
MTEDYLTDDEQLEQVKRIISENWAWVGGGIVLGAALIFGYRYYESSRNDRALRAAARFDDMTSALERNDPGATRQIAADLIKAYPTTPYADQAQLVVARVAVDDGRIADAVAPLTEVMNQSKDTELRHIARLRLARVLIDQNKPDEALKTLAEDSSPAFASQAHEVRGDAYYAKKDFKDAVTEYKTALTGGEPGSADASLLQLKIADLGASPLATKATAMVPGAVMPAPAAPPTAATASITAPAPAAPTTAPASTTAPAPAAPTTAPASTAPPTAAPATKAKP